MARIGTSATIPDVLQDLGLNPGEVLSDAGIPADKFENPDNLVSFTDRAHLMKICMERTRCPHFGLLVGQGEGLSSLGLIGYLVKHSPDVGSALDALVHYFHLQAQGSLARVTVNGDRAFLGYSIYQDDFEATDQLIDAAVAIIFNMLRELCGEEWKPLAVCFSHRKPASVKPFEDFFGTTLCFDARDNGVVFPAHWLQSPVQGADDELHRLLEKQVLQMESNYHEDFSGQVKRVLFDALLAGQASADYIAAFFSIHSRTLHRRLVAQGTSFHELVDESRFSIARQALENSEIAVAEIADMLGYSDTRAFTRAFKRWSGLTPSAWRGRKLSQ